jgi:hypothetical protein
MQLSNWLLVEVALLLIGLTKISFVKNWFGRLGRDQLSFRLSALDGAQDREFAAKSVLYAVNASLHWLNNVSGVYLKVHKIEIFFGFDFEICTFSLLFMLKY